MSAEMDRQLSAVLAKLDPHERRQVLAYVRTLRDRDDKPAPSLMKYCGTITSEDARLMREAIEEDFERVYGPV